MGGLSFGYMVIAILILLLLGFAVSFAFYGKEVFRSKKSDTKTKMEKTHPKKGVRDYLDETVFTFDPEDENRLISKNDPGLVIRISKGSSLDTVFICTNRPHGFNSVDIMSTKNTIDFIENIYFERNSHRIEVQKSPAEKWKTFFQELIEIIFSIYEEKYSTDKSE